jgi:anti-sigma factor RsiW
VADKPAFVGCHVVVPHISEDLLDQHALKRLPETEVATLEEHLSVCPECLDRLQLTDAF